MGKLFLALVVAWSSVSFAGFGTTYSGTADCGWAQDWPRENSATIFNQDCQVSLSVAPDGYNAAGQLVGDINWTVSDMRFMGTYFQIGQKLYLDFPHKKYSGFRGARSYNDRYGRSCLVIDGSREVVLCSR